jgi:hypothetical protein
MATGAVTLAWALLLANAGPADTMYINGARFQIPFSVRPERRADIRELVLYVSRDKGQTWSIEARALPDKGGFPFSATSDGTYWFSIALIDRQGRQDPVDIYQAPVGQRIVVDTRKPEVHVQRAERRGDEVHIQWEILEDNPDLATLRVEYRSTDAGGGPWTAVNVPSALQGETSIRANGPGNLQVRVLLSDLAGNMGQASVDVAGSGFNSPTTPEPAGSGNNFVPSPPGLGEPTTQSPAPTIPAPGGEFRPSDPASRPQYQAPVEAPRPPTPLPMPAPTQAPLAQSEPARPPIQQLGASAPARDWSSSTTQYSPPSRGTLPPLELVNKRQSKIDFQIGKYGPSGLGSVDVFVTTDDGATWTLSPADRNVVTLPSTGELRGGAPVTGSVTVDLQQEGTVYGYYIVVKSRAGRGIQPPQSGTPPQVRIEMDITPPSVELYVPQPDTSRRDTLLLTWNAKDKNQTANCVTLEWAERKDGQWNVIGSPDMANSGQFSWQVPANAPPSVFLRLAVRDAAGNVAVAQTQEPVLVDLSVPEPLSFKVTK